MSAPRCTPARQQPRPWQVVAARCLALAGTPAAAERLAAGRRQGARDGAARARATGAVTMDTGRRYADAHDGHHEGDEAQYAAIRKHLDAASAHLRLARVALDPPALLAIANEGPR